MATTAASSRLGVHLFGQPRFTLGGEPYAFNGRPKTVPLLAYLLLHRAGPVRRDSLAFTLWEDDEEEKARTNLRRHLHELGRLLPAAPVPWIVTEADTVLWNPAAALWFDVAEFERLIAGGDRAAAVDLYAGGLLENLYDEWLFGPRDRLHNAYLAALTELIVECRSARDFTGAKNYARRLLLADPWREDIVRQLMAVRYESGDRAGALQTFETFARSLRAEMDVDPMPETVALRDAVVRNAPAGPAHEAASEQRPAQPPAPKSVALPFVGRRNELEQLGAAWSRAARGRGSALLVSGEAGIGKTRLVGQLALQAEAEGGRVLWGATSSPESVAYQPVVDALRNALPMIATAALRPLVLASLAQISPNLRSRFPDLPVLPAIERERERTRLFDAIATAFEALAAPRPLVVVLEDLHWAEPATIAAFEFLVPRVSRRSILLIGTYRDEEVARLHPLRGLRRRLQPERLLAHLAVPPLAHEEVNELVAAPTRAAGLPLETGNDSVYAISEGNPLFVGEVIRNLVEGRTFDATLSTVHDLIGARFERLSPEARELAGIAATIGEAFDVDVLRETSGWSEPAMLAALDELQDRAIVREPVGRHRFDYAFTHNLVQRTIYASSPLPLQKRRHRRIARIMEDLFSSRLDSVAAEIARHYERGGDSARAAECYVRAARGATAVFANEEALAHARSAARLCGDDAALLFEALSIAEATNDRLGDRKAQRADLTALDKLARASDDRRQVCAILSRTVRYYRACGDREGERLTVDALKAEAQSAGDARWLGEAYEAEATYFEVIGKPAAALPVARHAVDEFDAAGDPRGLVSALTLRAAVAAYTGETAEADECINRAREVARVSQDAELAVRVLRCESNVCHWLERWQRHDEVAREALSLARSVGDRETEATSLGAVALSESRFARFREARAHFAESSVIFEAVGKLQGLATVCNNAAAIEIEAGLWEPALALLERGERLAVRCNWRWGEGLFHLNHGLIAELREDFLVARDYADKAYALVAERDNERLAALALSQRGSALLGLGEGTFALGDLDEACRLFKRCNATEALFEARAGLAQALWSVGEVDRALALALDIEQAYLSNAALHHSAPARTLWAAALVLHRVREPSAARVLRQSYVLLVGRRDAYEDEESRAAFMRIPVHGRIAAACERGEWPSHRA